MADSTTLIDFLSKAGLVSLLITILLAGMKSIWVWGWVYKEGLERERILREERDEWRDIAMHGVNLADRGVHLAGQIKDTRRRN